MKTSTIALIVISGSAAAAVFATTPCDLSAIEGSLLANGTAWRTSCSGATGVDVFMMSSCPTTAEAKSVSQSRDCVNYLNQLSHQANTAIQCETTVGDQTISFADLLTDLLTGKSCNTTKEAVVGSDSMSGSVSLSSSDSASASESSAASESESASSSEPESSSAASEEAESGSVDRLTSSKSASTSSASIINAATLSVVAAAAAAVLAFAL